MNIRYQVRGGHGLPTKPGHYVYEITDVLDSIGRDGRGFTVVLDSVEETKPPAKAPMRRLERS